MKVGQRETDQEKAEQHQHTRVQNLRLSFGCLIMTLGNICWKTLQNEWIKIGECQNVSVSVVAVTYLRKV